MKRKFINNLLVIGCIAALMMTGCTKNNQTDTSTNNTVTDVANTEGTEVTDLEDDEVKESDDDKEDETETSEEPSNADEDTNTDNNESEDDSVESKEDNNTDNEEVSTPDSDVEEKEEESQGGSTGNSNSSGGNNSSSENGNNGNTGSNSGTGNNNSSSSGNGSTTTTPAPHTHTYDSGVITRNASCTATGVKTFTCSCGTTYTETIPVTAHNFYLGYCTVCNAADPSYVETYTYEVVLEYGMIDLVNARRAACGYGALSWDSSLDETAKRRARELVDNFVHDYNLPASELITCSGRYMSASDCHTNYVNSSGHDDELHKKSTYTKISSATCYKKDSRGNVVATYNVILLDSDDDGSTQIPVNPGTIDPNPPGPDDIIW